MAPERKCNRLPIFVQCPHNSRLACKGQNRKTYLCPIQDAGFTAALDFYFEGGIRNEYGAPIPVDPNAVHSLKCIEIATWFDNDFRALEAYCTWKHIGFLSMSPRLCREFRDAWCRYFVRMQPLGVIKPAWMRGYSKWQCVSIGFQRHGNNHLSSSPIDGQRQIRD